MEKIKKMYISMLVKGVNLQMYSNCANNCNLLHKKLHINLI
mgnify:CR=1 FL=1